jgi:hypothetical protein
MQRWSRAIGLNSAQIICHLVLRRPWGDTVPVECLELAGHAPLHHAQGASDDDWFIGFNIARKCY